MSRRLNPSPVILMGGGLSFWFQYKYMAKWLQEVTGRQCYIVKTLPFNWLKPFNVELGQKLKIIDATITNALHRTSAQNVILVGHSVGGVLGVIYLSNLLAPGDGLVAENHSKVAHLICLGSPFHSEKSHIPGLRNLSSMVNNAKLVECEPIVSKVTSIIGTSEIAKSEGTIRQRVNGLYYWLLSNQYETSGDGLVTMQNGVFSNHQAIYLENVTHGLIRGGIWYGHDLKTITRWWTAVVKEQYWPLTSDELALID